MPGRRVVLLFTDGDDTDSDASSRDVLNRAIADEVMIYSIGFESNYFNGARFVTTRPDRNLRRFAEETGGGYFELTEAADLGPTFTRVAQELHSQYVIGFTPQRDGRRHEIECASGSADGGAGAALLRRGRRPPTTAPDRPSVTLPITGRRPRSQEPDTCRPRHVDPCIPPASSTPSPRCSRRTASADARRGADSRRPTRCRSRIITADFGLDEDTVVAALLHDTLEDTDLDPGVIETRFGKPVLRMVQDVSEPPKPARWKTRKLAYLEQLRTTPRLGSLAVASADKIHNLTKMVVGIESRGAAFLHAFSAGLDEMQWYQNAVYDLAAERWSHAYWRSTGGGSTPSRSGQCARGPRIDRRRRRRRGAGAVSGSYRSGPAARFAPARRAGRPPPTHIRRRNRGRTRRAALRRREDAPQVPVERHDGVPTMPATAASCQSITTPTLAENPPGRRGAMRRTQAPTCSRT